MFRNLGDPELAQLLAGGAVGVLPTDTLYGVVASAYNAASIERLYLARNRPADKACVVLAGSLETVQDWLQVDLAAGEFIKKHWPGPVSIVLPVTAALPAGIPTFNNTLAVRVPAFAELHALLQKTGPLLAPSANLAGEPPAKNVTEAQAYFGDAVDFYVDGGDLVNKPSALVSFASGKPIILRGEL